MCVCVCVCVCVSLPYIIQDASSAHVWRLEQLCDSVVRLESFAGSEDELSALYRDYHGTCMCLLCGAFASVYKQPITSYKSKIKLFSNTARDIHFCCVTCFIERIPCPIHVRHPVIFFCYNHCRFVPHNQTPKTQLPGLSHARDT